MTDSTSMIQCIECTRHANAGASWFWLNGWGPLCGICYFKITGRHETAHADPEAIHEGMKILAGLKRLPGKE